MTRSEPSSSFQPVPVQFSRLSRRGILLGLTLPQLLAVSSALLTIVLALYISGAEAVMWTAPIWVSAVVGATLPVGGRKVVEWTPVIARWCRRVLSRQLTYRKRIEQPRPAGTLAPRRCRAPSRMGRHRVRCGDDPRSARADPGCGSHGVPSRVRAAGPRGAAASARHRMGSCTCGRMPIRANRAVAGLRADPARLGHRARRLVGPARRGRCGLGCVDVSRAYRSRWSGGRASRHDDHHRRRSPSSRPTDPCRRWRHARIGERPPPGDGRRDRSTSRRGSCSRRMAGSGTARRGAEVGLRSGDQSQPGTASVDRTIA